MHGAMLHDMGPAFQAGVTCTVGPERWWLRPQLGVFQASATSPYVELNPKGVAFGSQVLIDGTYQRGEIQARTTEIDLGVEHAWRWGFLRSTAALGVSWVQMEVDDVPSLTLLRQISDSPATTRSDSGRTVGGWSSVAFEIPVGDARCGITGRYTYAHTTMFDQAVDAGGLQVGAQVAWAW
jgi:hypothetical protein